MKTTMRFCLILLGSVFMMLNAQKEVKLNIHHFMGGTSFALNQDHSNVSIAPLHFERVEYYLSNFRIVHDGGQLIYMDDVWLLVNGAKDSVFSLGTHNGVTNIEEIRFAVGVNPEVNHLDPSTYAAGHPLGHHLPSMHWGWTSGYRFIAIESVEQNNMQTVEVHTIGDKIYDSLSLTPSANTIQDTILMDIYADYTMAFWGVDFQGGLITHGEINEAVTVTQNFINHVFSTQQPSSIASEEIPLVQIYPNPSQGQLNIHNLQDNMTLNMVDIMGKAIPFTKNGSELKTNFKGLAFLQIEQAGKTIETLKVTFE